jgi:D-serine deaminase-like pyridoxal phosphate-dependent protein
MHSLPWWHVANASSIPSPALILHHERVVENIRRMIAIAGDPLRLRPHIKTAKMPEVARLQINHGIRKFKCATIAEAEMLGQAGATDVLLAYQPVGPHIERFLQLVQRFPSTQFSTLVDAAPPSAAIQAAAQSAHIPLHLWLDLDCGMHRTGVPAGPPGLRTLPQNRATPVDSDRRPARVRRPSAPA